MNEDLNLKEAANEAAVINNVEAAEAATTSVEPAEGADAPEAPAEAANLLEVALSTAEGARKEQCKLFGRHFSSTQKVEVILKGVNDHLKEIDGWKQNLEALKEEIQKETAAKRLKAVVEDAAKLDTAELQQMIEELQKLAS